MTRPMTELRILDAASSKGEGDANEDLVGSAGAYAWMFDGATDMPPTLRPDPRVTGAYWLAHFGDTWLRENVRDQEPHELLGGIAAAVRKEIDHLEELDDGLSPASSAAIVRIDGTRLAAAAVGDVSVYNISQGELLLDPYYAAVEHAAVAEQSRSGDAAAATAGIVARRRELLSDGGDQWILGDNPMVGDAALRREWPAEVGQELLLATDGFARAVTDYGLAGSWDALVGMIRSHGVQGVIDRIRRFEVGADRTHFFKRSDDACAALIRCA